MASSVNSLVSSTATGTTASPSSATGAASAPSEQMFLQLLVSQIQNQNPLNPTDSSQFVSQLAQFSELEQVIAIRSDTDAIAKSQSAAGNPSASSPATGAVSTPAANNPASLFSTTSTSQP